jgi:hypothetical protein
MGLLDDAIREHLDLKRRRGADPNEVARQEQEALGPPRTGQFATPDDEERFDLEPDEPSPYATEEMALPAEQPGDPAASVAAELYEEPIEEKVADEEPWPDETGPEPRGGVRRSTAEFTHADDVSEPEPAPPPGDEAGEDVLEETPDFLQETPEHDRLWFEQRPPRDFDFDK